MVRLAAVGFDVEERGAIVRQMPAPTPPPALESSLMMRPEWSVDENVPNWTGMGTLPSAPPSAGTLAAPVVGA